jgi:hypothetical protein
MKIKFSTHKAITNNKYLVFSWEKKYKEKMIFGVFNQIE